MQDETKPRAIALEGYRVEWLEFWNSHPNKALFFILLAGWLVLFQFIGSSVLGYIKTPSLFSWLHYVYSGSPDDEHGMLVPFGVAFLFWWKRKELIAVPKVVWPPALGFIGVALLMHIVGYSVQIPQVSVAALFLGLYGIMGLVWGSRWLRASFFPMILFAFCVPLAGISDPITVPLRMLATNITAFLCQNVLGIALIKRGNQLFDPTYKFQYEVVAACGGIHSLIALLALTTLYSFMNFRTFWRKAVMIASAVPLAVVGNVVRLSSIIVVAEAFGQESGNFVHDKLGLLPYIPAIGGILLLGYWLREPDKASAPVSNFSSDSGRRISVPQFTAVAFAMVFMVASAAYLFQLKGRQRLGSPGLKMVQKPVFTEAGKMIGTNTIDLPTEISGYQTITRPISTIECNTLPPDTTFARQRYFFSDLPDKEFADATVVLMGADRTSIHKPQYCLETQGWRIEKSESVDIPISRPHRYNLPVMKLTTSQRVKGADGRPEEWKALYVYWFVSSNQLTADHRERVWWMAKDLVLTGVLQRWAYVSFLSVCKPGQEDVTFEHMKKLIASTTPEFQLVSGPEVKTEAHLSKAVQNE